MKRLRIFQFKSILTSMAFAFSCLILVATVILSYNAYRLSSVSVKENSIDYTGQLIEQVGTNIETYIDNMKSISSLAFSNGQISSYLALDNPDTPSGAEQAKRIEKTLQSIVRTRSDIAAILFVGSNGTVLSDRDSSQIKNYSDLITQGWYTHAQNRSLYLSSSEVEHVYKGEYRWVVSMSQQVVDPDVRGKSGVLLVDLNYNVINDLCRQIRLGKRGYVFIVNSDGDLIYHPQQQIINTELKSENMDAILHAQDGSVTIRDGGENKIYSVRTTDFGWKIVGVSYEQELIGDKRKIQVTSALWGAICLVVGLGLSFLLSFTFIRPIQKLTANMKQVEQGDFNIRADVLQPNEIGRLAKTFNLMIGKIKDLMHQIVQEQETIRTSEIKALQSQIQPHFLYNTLDSIIWMAETNKMGEVVTMTTSLSRLLRSSIGKGEEEVPLSVELEHVSNYLMIQSMRYKKKFTYAIDVEPELHDCRILKVILQPLVENAIYHGIKKMVEVGHIRIYAKRDGDTLAISVSDNGLGMSQETVQSLTEEALAPASSRGVGVWNVHNRLRIYYGAEYGLSYVSELEEGTIATLRIPFRIWEGEPS
ncbi:sensor histidine kinase [Paenibacillus albus]|uniref:histidine kinase n=1 Tax=Paenibacillus albus TaxID=2495582 RepID=A0A3Q8XA78_9BACL|nr:sensor histidine kinase [Paenibacillus albus]AZN42880.1 sensor histidine kinase [Paenibacillus albus]